MGVYKHEGPTRYYNIMDIYHANAVLACLVRSMPRIKAQNVHAARRKHCQIPLVEEIHTPECWGITVLAFIFTAHQYKLCGLTQASW